MDDASVINLSCFRRYAHPGTQIVHVGFIFPVRTRYCDHCLQLRRVVRRSARSSIEEGGGGVKINALQRGSNITCLHVICHDVYSMVQNLLYGSEPDSKMSTTYMCCDFA